MAGEEGFEPSNAGIKIRCLDQLGDSPTQPLTSVVALTLNRQYIARRKPATRTLRAGDVTNFSHTCHPTRMATFPSLSAQSARLQSGQIRRLRNRSSLHVDCNFS